MHFLYQRTLGTIFAFLLWSGMAPAQTVKVASGRVQRFENFPSAFVQPRTVDVWLPEGYDPSQKYAVLYMNDGQMLFDSTTTWNHQEWGVDETMGELLTADKIRRCLVVGIWNNGAMRHAEYFPQKPFESLSASEKQVIQAALPAAGKLFEPISDQYLKFLVTELKPFIDSSFSTKRNRNDTFIAGSSMGGLISIYAICEFPTVFGGAACLSTHWPGIFRNDNNPFPNAMLRYLEGHLPDPVTHIVYFDYGTETLDSMYKTTQIKVDVLMKQNEQVHGMTREFQGADHSEKAWRARLHYPLEFILTKFNYPRYDGNPIVWEGESYWGNIKMVETESYIMKDNIRSNKTEGWSKIILFNEQWQVTQSSMVRGDGYSAGVNIPYYNDAGNVVENNRLKEKGSLNSFSVNEYQQGICKKTTEYSSYGGLCSTTEFEYQADTCTALKRYYNSEKQALDPNPSEKTITITRNSNPISLKSTNKFSILWQANITYTKFDKYGNWIECRTVGEFLGEAVEEITIRKITYY